MRLLQVTTKSMHSDLLPSKQYVSTFKESEYELTLDLDVRRAVRIAARPSVRLGDYFRPPYWIPLEDVKDWHEAEPPTAVPTAAAKGKGAA